jgi:hypothetical protein
MRPYGVPRRGNLRCPDVQECVEFGKPSRFNKQHSKRKRSTRRLWKKKARAKTRRWLKAVV